MRNQRKLAIFFWISVFLNITFLLLFAIKRFYYTYGAGAEDPKKAIAYFDKWDRMRNSVISKIPIDTSDVVFAGNSLTEGFPVTEIYGQHYKNRGISGNLTVHLLKRITTIARARPRKIFIEIGINDVNDNIPADSILTNYKRIIEVIKKYSPATSVYVQSLLPVSMSHSASNKEIRIVNNLLAGFCRQASITYIDLYTPMNKSYGLDSSLTADGLHLNANGYHLWQERIRPFL